MISINEPIYLDITECKVLSFREVSITDGKVKISGDERQKTGSVLLCKEPLRWIKFYSGKRVGVGLRWVFFTLSEYNSAKKEGQYLGIKSTPVSSELYLQRHYWQETLQKV